MTTPRNGSQSLETLKTQPSLHYTKEWFNEFENVLAYVF